jgi:dUTP pyrophosphatase
MEVQIKKLVEEAVIPSYARIGDAGLDLTAVSRSFIRDEDMDMNAKVEYGTGIAMKIPEGYVGLVFPRSSIKDKGLILTNCVGVIDSKMF